MFPRTQRKIGFSRTFKTRKQVFTALRLGSVELDSESYNNHLIDPMSKPLNKLKALVGFYMIVTKVEAVWPPEIERAGLRALHRGASSGPD